MKTMIAMALSVILAAFSPVRLIAEENMPERPEDYRVLADRAYADTAMNSQERKAIMDTMISAGDRWPDDYEIQWRAAQAIHVYGDSLYYEYQWENYNDAVKRKRIQSAEDVIERSQKLDKTQSAVLLQLGLKARKYAEKAVKIKPGGVEGRYYNAMAISLYAFGKSIVSALLEGLGPRYEENLNEALKAKRDYMDGALYAAYGRYWYKLPWPKRDIGKSKEYLLKAKELGPDDTQVLDFLGDTCYASGSKEEAKRFWNDALHSLHEDYHGETVKKLVQAKLDHAQ